MAETLVRHYCDQCRVYREGLGIRLIPAGASKMAMCASCGSALRSESQRIRPPLLNALIGAFAHPVGSLPVALTWVGVSLLSFFASLIPLVGGPLSLSLMLAYLFAIIRITGLGHEDLGSIDWEPTHFTEWFGPLVRYILTLLVAFLPAAVAAVMLGPLAGWIMVALGICYLPAGMVIAAQAEGCLAPLNPVPSITLISRIPGAYVLTLGSLVLAAAAGVGITLAAKPILGTSFLALLLTRVLSLYAPSVMARMLGIMVREHAEEL